MQALILVGGAGTRLRSVLSGLNKPMAPVAGRPFLEYLLLQLKKYGIHDVTLCAGYKADLIRSHFGAGDRWGMQVGYSRELGFLGTAGAIKLAEAFIHDDDFVVMNGDSLLDIELRTLMRYHRCRNATATIALARVDDAQRYGVVELGAMGRIVEFTEKREGPGGGLINGGVYVFDRKVLDLIPEGRHVSLETDVLPCIVGGALYGMPSTGYFVDIGVPEDYMRLRSAPAQLLAAVDPFVHS